MTHPTVRHRSAAALAAAPTTSHPRILSTCSQGEPR